MKVVLLTIGILGLGLAAIGIKVLFKKDGKFAGTCSSGSVLLRNDDGGCSFCGAKPEEVCKNPDKA